MIGGSSDPAIDLEPMPMGEGLLYQVTKGAYKNRFVTFRELIINALDQYEHEDLVKQKTRPVIRVELDRVRREIFIKDYATGIEDIKDFLRMGTLDSTGHTGKKVGNQVSTRYTPHDAIKGKKHIGKGSSVFASESGEVEFYSNDGKIGYFLKTKGLAWVRYEDEVGNKVSFKRMVATEAKPERGLTVKILNAYPELLVMERVENAIVDWLGLRIARGAKIYLIDKLEPEKVKQLQKPKDLKTIEDKHNPIDALALTLKSGKKIKTCLDPEEKPEYLNLTVYVNGVKVKKIHFPYKVKGWVDDPELVENISRDDFIEDDELGAYAEFKDKVEPYIAKYFDRLGTSEDGKKEKSESKSLSKAASRSDKDIC